MATPEVPGGEDLMAVYGALLDVVSPEEHAWMDQLMERATIHGNFTPGRRHPRATDPEQRRGSAPRPGQPLRRQLRELTSRQTAQRPVGAAQPD